MSIIKTVVKRDGSEQEFSPEKLNRWAEYATKTGGNWSEISLETYKRLPDKVKTSDIHQTMINVCLDKEQIEYSRVAARLEHARIRKTLDSYGIRDSGSFKDIYDFMLEKGVWGKEALPAYNPEWEDWYKDIYNNKLEYWQIKQWSDKYSRKLDGKVIETPHIGAMGIGLGFHGDTQVARKLAKGIIEGKINLPTPALNGVRNNDFNTISCCVITGGDSVDSILTATHLSALFTSKKSGIGVELDTRSKGDPVKGGAVDHLGKHSLYASIDTAVKNFCYDKETEVLTNRGYVLFKDLTEDDLVAQVHDDRSLSFVKPSEYVKEKYEGDMYRFSKLGVDVCVTPNHRMAYRTVTYDNKNKQTSNGYILSRADEFTPRRTTAWDFGGNLNGTYTKLSTLDRLRVAFQADGGVKYNKTASNSYIFSLKKLRKVERLLGIMEDLGIDYHDTKNMKSGYSLRTRDTIRGEYKYITIKKPDFCLDKDLNWVYSRDWCLNSAKEFFEELRHWDGDLELEGNQLCVYNTSLKYCADAVQYVASVSGIRSSIKKYGDMYRVFVYDSDCVTGESTKIEVFNYNDYIYCVTVPTHKLVVRRNGYTSVCGNTQITRGGSATVTFKCIDPEAEQICLWKTQRVDVETRLDKIDYSMAYNNAFLEAVVKGDDWYLFSLKNAPEAHEAFYKPQTTLADYKDMATRLPHVVVKARDLLKTFLIARNETGRVYCFNVSRANEHTPFLDRISLSNL